MYTELHTRTNFSFLEAASHPDELAARAAELEYAAWAVTDKQSLAGVVRAHVAAKEAGIKLIVGAELWPTDAPPLVVWVTDRASYGRLSRLLTVGRRRAPKGECHLTVADIAEHAAGLIAGIIPSTPSLLASYRDIFPDRCYLLAELFRGPDDERRLAELQTLSRETKLPLVAAGDVRYHTAARQPLFDVLTAIRLGTTVAALDANLLPNAERHLRPIDEIQQRFASCPAAISRTLEIAARCQFSLDELRYEYPEELAPAGRSPLEYLTELTWLGAAERYPHGLPEKVKRLLEHELTLIAELQYEAYFLTVWDLVRFARGRDILCQGRGSAANSAVCFCLGVTSVDPERSDLLFERFISKERNEAPDIDIDFEHERREEVLQYLYDKYGRERAGMTAVVIRYRSRSAIRDVGKALGLSLDRVDALAKQVEGYAKEEKLPQRCAQVGIDPQSSLGRQFVHLVDELLDFPRHLSQHVGGMIITRGPLCELVPLENAAMPGRTVIEWDKDDLDDVGILKIDCLSLGMLTAIRKCFALIEAHHGERWTPATIPAEDPKVYDMICAADTMGVFQIESRAQMSMLPRLQPRCFYDLVIEVAIVRPGPIQGQMVHPYLRRRKGEEVPPYPSEAIREVLHKTLGVPLFQEQAMRLAVVAAGFTPGEADQLRRAMGAWRRPGVIDQFHRKLIEGMLARGLTAEFAEAVFLQIRGFGEYGFPESHAASFALLVYVSAWLKCYYPAAFAAAIINSQPMGFYAPSQLIRDARQHGVEVRPVDVNASGWDCTLSREKSGEWSVESGVNGRETAELISSPGRQNLTAQFIRFDPSALNSLNSPHSPHSTPHSSLRLGFRLIEGLPSAAVETLLRERERHGPFRSLADFTHRTKLPQSIITRLAEADVFGSLEIDRRLALWQALGQERVQKPRGLFAALRDEEPPPALPPLSPFEQVLADYRTSGLSLKGHPIGFLRPQLTEAKVASSAALEHLPADKPVQVGGIVLLRQRPGTAKGITFVTLEDETGVANLVIKQAVWDRFQTIARRSPAWIAEGILQKADSVIHVVVRKIHDLSQHLAAVPMKSRDFR